MERTGDLGKYVLSLLLIALLGIATACGNGDDADDPGNGDGSSSDSEVVNVSDDAPDPISVSADDLAVIDEWRDAGVPRFRDGAVLDFEPHASRIENGGTLLLDGDNASAEEIISFYRGALDVLGWEERRVNSREMTAESDRASLLVTVTEHENETLIMMILTDRLGTGRSQD